MKIICAWCKRKLGDKPGSGISHGICNECQENASEMGADVEAQENLCRVND